MVHSFKYRVDGNHPVITLHVTRRGVVRCPLPRRSPTYTVPCGESFRKASRLPSLVTDGSCMQNPAQLVKRLGSPGLQLHSSTLNQCNRDLSLSDSQEDFSAIHPKQREPEDQHDSKAVNDGLERRRYHCGN